MPDPTLYDLAERVGRALKAHGLMMATAESCTGGWIAEAMTMVPGSSEWFERMDDYGDLPAKQFSYALSNRRGAYPLWRYLLHVSTQRGAGRAMLRRALALRRWSRARRRPGFGAPVEGPQHRHDPAHIGG